MREIKFRAWHSKYGYSSPFGIGGHPEWNDGMTVSYFSSVCQFEQFTGLNDKNGKEIYEGDIVICTYGKWHEEPKGLTRIGKVVYDIKTCAFKIAVKDSAVLVSLYDTKTKDIEVIGNIHENPELLND